MESKIKIKPDEIDKITLTGIYIDSGLDKIDRLARILYSMTENHVHNYNHAVWDTKRLIYIKTNEAEDKEDDYTLREAIAAGIWHDIGVNLGEYKEHDINGSKIIKRVFPYQGFSEDETLKVARAVSEHDKYGSQTILLSKHLWDADTLNKAGLHGIEQCKLVMKEFGDDYETFVPRCMRSIGSKQLYTDTAKHIDKIMGISGMGGLETTLQYWKRLNDEFAIRGGYENAFSVVQKVDKEFGIE